MQPSTASPVIKVFKVSPHAVIPTRGTPGAAGFDLYAAESVPVPRGGRRWISCGLAIEMPPGMYGQVLPRSGLCSAGVDIGAGVIDSDYRGMLRVLVVNNLMPGQRLAPVEANGMLDVTTGMRIAQIVFHSHYSGELALVQEVSATERGEAGFGSTGV